MTIEELLREARERSYDPSPFPRAWDRSNAVLRLSDAERLIRAAWDAAYEAGKRDGRIEMLNEEAEAYRK